MSFVYPGVVPEASPAKEEPPKPKEKPVEGEEKSATWTQKVAALFTSKDDK